MIFAFCKSKRSEDTHERRDEETRAIWRQRKALISLSSHPHVNAALRHFEKSQHLSVFMIVTSYRLNTQSITISPFQARPTLIQPYTSILSSHHATYHRRSILANPAGATSP